MTQVRQETQSMTPISQACETQELSTRTQNGVTSKTIVSASKVKQICKENANNDLLMEKLKSRIAQIYLNSTFGWIEKGEECIFGDHLTIIDLKNLFGYEFAISLLMPLIKNIVMSSNLQKTMDDVQIRSICYNIITDEMYRTLKITEFILFTNWFISQHDEETKFYGTVSPLVISRSLGKFIGYRNNIISKREEAEKMKKVEESRTGGISYEEWLKRSGKKTEETNIGKLMNKFKVKPNNNPLLNVGGNNK